MDENTPRPTHIAFERNYADSSGVEFAVRYSPSGVEFEHIDKVEFPPEELDWLIACLQQIKEQRNG